MCLWIDTFYVVCRQACENPYLNIVLLPFVTTFNLKRFFSYLWPGEENHICFTVFYFEFMETVREAFLLKVKNGLEE